MAQSNLNSTTSNPVEVGAGAASIPQSTGVALPNPTTLTSTSSSASKTQTPTSTATSTSSNNPTNTSSLHKNHAVAIGVGVGVSIPVAFILAILAAWFCIWRRHRKAKSQPTAGQPIEPSSSPTEVAGSEVKTPPLSYNHFQANMLTPEPTYPTNHDHNPAEMPSPHDSLQGKPWPVPVAQVPRVGDGFLVHSYQEGGGRPLSDEGFSEPREELRPMSGVTRGPLEDMPSG